MAFPADAETLYKDGAALRAQRRLDEALAAFDKAIAVKPDYAEAHNSRGIVLANLGRLDEAVAALGKAIALKSDYAEAYNNRGIVLQDLKRDADALASFDRALSLQPDNPRIYNNRGDTLRSLNRPDDALASYDRAIELKADYAEAHYNRGTMLHELDRFDAAIASFDRAIALKPDYAAAYNNRGIVLKDLKRLDQALANFDKALALDPDWPEACLNKAYCLLEMGRYEEGWRLHEARKHTEAPTGNRSFPQPVWLGGYSLAGKTVFVHCEQGFGDTIQFCRYARLLVERGARVVLAVQQPLLRLLRDLGRNIEVIGQDQVPTTFDFHCPLLSLPLAFGTTLTNAPSQPYIFADKALREIWSARLPPPDKPRIGVVWSGNANQKNDRNRSAGLAALAPLLTADAHWISLQKELRDGDAALLAGLPQVSFYGDQLSDFADTAALIDPLDLVIAVDTSVAHLAGAMGKPVWMLLAHNADWRYLAGRDDSPWYPSAKLFRQDERRSWEPVIARIAAALRDVIPARS